MRLTRPGHRAWQSTQEATVQSATDGAFYQPPR
jgi:hypothetical protein